MKPERRYEQETVRRLRLGLMEDFLAGFSCPESPLENRISGFYTHIGSISPAGAVRVLCAFFLSEGFEHFVFMVT